MVIYKICINGEPIAVRDNGLVLPKAAVVIIVDGKYRNIYQSMTEESARQWAENISSRKVGAKYRDLGIIEDIIITTEITEISNNEFRQLEAVISGDVGIRR